MKTLQNFLIMLIMLPLGYIGLEALDEDDEN
jgi:hypothetical protein